MGKGSIGTSSNRILYLSEEKVFKKPLKKKNKRKNLITEHPYLDNLILHKENRGKQKLNQNI